MGGAGLGPRVFPSRVPAAEEQAALELLEGPGSATVAGFCVRGLVTEEKTLMIGGGHTSIPAQHLSPTAFCSKPCPECSVNTTPLSLTWELAFRFTHFTEEEAESHKGQGNCPSQAWSAVELGSPCRLSISLGPCLARSFPEPLASVPACLDTHRALS